LIIFWGIRLFLEPGILIAFAIYFLIKSMDIFNDDRVVMTLDAGGTNLVFSAMQGGKEIVESEQMPSHPNDLDQCLKSVISGFEQVRLKLKSPPVAISFAFPGPADYTAGIIGDLPNFPVFRGGVALGPLLEAHFGIPVFINNDGNLFAFGEAMGGILPEINQMLKESGIDKSFNNLFGVTLGTGFGGGIVVENNLYGGDNAASGEIWLMRNFLNTRINVEETVSVRGVKRAFHENTRIPSTDNLEPKDIYDIAVGERSGDKEAALKAYDDMALVIAESLANAITLLDGVMVIGGGIAGAKGLLMPRVVNYLNGNIELTDGTKLPRLVSKVYNMDDEGERKSFTQFTTKAIPVPFSDKKVTYIPEKRLPIGTSRLGTSQAIALGAYAFALKHIK